MLTRTRTLPSSETSDFSEQVTRESTINEIQEQVNERGFYLYEWISPDELRMSVQADYLSVVRKASTPLAIITFIAGLIGLAAWPIGVIGAIIAVLWIFYSFVFLYLILKMIRRSYLYTRGADVVITDHHYVSWGDIIEKKNLHIEESTFRKMGELFREPLFEPSRLSDYVKLERKSLLEQLKDIASGWGKIVGKIGRSKDAGGIILVILLWGILYGAMMAGVYFIGVFFVALLARFFSWVAHWILLALNNLEYEIQNLFSRITESSIELKAEKKNTLSLLGEASKNEWVDNLRGKLDESFAMINKRAKSSLDESEKLKNLLETSKYKDIFNFVKYGNWIQRQILEPIEEILELLTKNYKKIDSTIVNLESQIITTLEPSLKRPLELQKDRLILQKESFDRMMKMLEGYKEKLTN